MFRKTPTEPVVVLVSENTRTGATIRYSGGESLPISEARAVLETVLTNRVGIDADAAEKVANFLPANGTPLVHGHLRFTAQAA